jgi:hypothetical protein
MNISHPAKKYTSNARRLQTFGESLMLFLLRHFSTYAGGSGCEDRLWRGLR